MKSHCLIFIALLLLTGCAVEGNKSANGAGAYGGISGGLSIS